MGKLSKLEEHCVPRQNIYRLDTVESELIADGDMSEEITDEYT